MKLGTMVEIIQPIIVDEVVDVKWNIEAGQPEMLVRTAPGEERWVLNTQIKEVGEGV